MDFLLQIIRLLSEPPGNIIYHLITLLALEVVFALSYSRWRRDEDDDLAQRFMWASAGIFLGRILLLVVGLFYSRQPQQAAAILPPLEQAINTATVVLLVWSLVPRPTRWPRLWDILLFITLVLIGVFYLFSAQEWNEQINTGVTYIGGTPQAVTWTIIQIIFLVSGLIYLLLNSDKKEPLPTIILGILLLSAVIHLWNFVEFVPTDTNVPYWTRLGYLITFPLWALYAYQRTLSPLLTNESTYMDSVVRFGESLTDAAEVIATRQRERRISKSLDMASHLIDASFASIGLVDRRNPRRINFSSNLTDAESAAIKHWAIDLTRHPTLNASFIQDQTIELLPTGLGARQLHDFYGAFGIDPRGPLLIHPLEDNGMNFGLLVIAAIKEQELWADDQKSLMPGLAGYISQAVANTDLPAVRYSAVPPAPEPREVTETVPSAIFLDQVRLSSLEAERDELQSALEEAVERRKRAEEKVLVVQKQARYLAAAYRALQQSQRKEGIDPVPTNTVIAGTEDTSPQAEESSST